MKSLKLVVLFPCIGSNITSTENDVNTRIGKAWTAMNKLSIMWNFDLSGEMKQNSSQLKP